MSKPVKAKNIKKASTRIQRKPIEQDDIRQAFTHLMPPVQTSVSYKVVLVVVALIMIWIPLSYLGLLSLIGYYAYQQYLLYDILSPSVWVLLLVLLFLIKPIFFRDRSEPKSVTLERSAEPIFFAYIDSICQCIGAPRPNNIHMNCDLNAGAGFNRGFLGFAHNKLDLHLGLPLIVGLDTRQLTGVLAHEFGHFSQGFGMRAGYIIQRINFWIEKVVYQRDIFDISLARFAQTIGRLGIIAQLLVAFIPFLIWLNRVLLWLLMRLAQLCSSILSRQLEFNADRHAIQMVGNNDFVGTLKHLPIIEVAQQGAMSDLFEAWRDRRLGDNVPALVYNNIKRLPADTKQSIINHGLTHNTKLYDSHPSSSERIRHSMQHLTNGIAVLERRPASDLFRQFEQLCQQVTLALYQDNFEIAIQENTLIQTSQLIENVEQEEAAHASYLRYFQNQWGYHPLFPMRQHTVGGAISMDKLERELSRAHAAFHKDMHMLRDIGTELDLLDQRIKHLQQALLLKQSGFQFDRVKLQVPNDSVTDIQAALDVATAEHAQKSIALKPFEALLIKRMAITYKMLQLPEADDLIEERDATLQEYKIAREHLIALSAHIDLITDLRYHWWGLHGMLSHYESQSHNQNFLDTLGVQAHTVQRDLQQIHEALSDMRYPYEHALKEISVAAYLMSELPDAQDLDGIYNNAEQCIGHYMVLYHRLLGCIALTGEAMEEACQLPAIFYVNDDDLFPE